MIQAPATNKLDTFTAITTRRLNRWLKLGLDYALTLPTMILIAPLLLLFAARG